MPMSFRDLFDRHFQDSFVSHMMRDSQFLDVVAQDISAELFPDEAMSRLVRVILEHYNKENCAPDICIFQKIDEHLTNKALTADQHKSLRSLADELFSVVLQNRTFLLNEFTRFCRIQKYRAELPKITGLLDRGDLDACDSVLGNVLDYRVGQGLSMGRFYDPTKAFDRIGRRDKANARRLWTLIKELDNIVPGLELGNIGMVQSRKSSDGKTAFLTTLARSFAIQSARVVIFTIGDMTEDQYEDRLDMCFNGLTREDLRNSDAILEAQRRIAKFRGAVHVKEFPAYTTKVSDLQRYVKRLESLYSFCPEAIIIDYADCIGPETQSLRGDIAAAGQEVFSLLKAWVGDERKVCWTAAQSGRGAATETYAEQHHVAGSYDKVRIVDLIVSIQRTTQTETVLKITKTRHSGGANQSFQIPTNFERMQFYDSHSLRETE